MDNMEKLDEKNIFTDTQVDNDSSDTNRLSDILMTTKEQGMLLEQFIKNQVEVKDGLIDKLHKELDYYKQNVADRFIDQVMKALIKVRKDMKRQISSEGFTELSAQELQKEYIYVFEDITDLLEQQNIDAYSSEPGDMFDASIHQPKTEITNDLAYDKRIKKSISEGYKKGEKILIPEKVIVYQYKSQDKGE